MKTQQEIILKAKEYAESIGSKDGTCMYDYAMGYTQCQKDMADKKYTKEDVLKAGEIGEINHHDYKHIVSLLDEAKELNKTNKEFMSKETLDELFDLHDDDDFIHEDSDKKYTEEDLKEAFKQSRQAKIFEKGMPPVWESFEDYINSLNKQD